jgi:hypothetical protein
MKKFLFFPIFMCVACSAFSQDHPTMYADSFRTLYKSIALHPSHVDFRGKRTNPVIKKWDKDITIYVEGSTGKDRREVLEKLKSTVSLISPSLENKIRVSFTKNKAVANYIVDLDNRGPNRWSLKWDDQGNIYSCIVRINTSDLFNLDQQAAVVSQYFLKTLGDFVMSDDTLPTVFNMRNWRKDVNEVDLQILKLHYSDDIKPGMSAKDLDDYFARHSN